MSAGTLKAWLTNEPTPDARPPKRRKGTQQTLFDLKKVVVLEDVIKHKGTLKDDGASTEALVEALEALSRMHFTYKILLQTKVGKSVRRLNYNTSSSVRKLSKALVAKWTAVIEAPKVQRTRLEPHVPVDPAIKVRSSARQTLAVKMLRKCKEPSEAQNARAAELAAEAEDAIFAAAMRTAGKRYGRCLRELIGRLEGPGAKVLLAEIWRGSTTCYSLLDSSPTKEARSRVRNRPADSRPDSRPDSRDRGRDGAPNATSAAAKTV